jgi:signal transduction histidine kinase
MAVEERQSFALGKPQNRKSKKVAAAKAALVVAVAAVSLYALFILSQFNYLLFHSTVEFFSVVIAFAIFTIAWNSRRLMDSNYLLFIGIAFLFIGGAAFLHALTYKGMNVFPGIGANWATQLWIAMRYMLSLSMLGALVFVHRKFNPNLVLVTYATIFGLLLATIFYWQIFPTAYVEGVGLTQFKVISEFVVSAILLGAIAMLVKNRREFSGNIVRYVVAAMATIIAAEMSFTLYVDVYGVFNMVGHLLNVVAFYLIYKALIETGLSRPYDLLFHNLKKSEGDLANRAADLAQLNEKLEESLSSQKELQDKLEQYSKHLETLVEEKTAQLRDKERLAAIGQTAGMVGHDLRNPLQTLSGEAYLAKIEVQSLPESEQKKNLLESLGTFQEQIIYMNKIISDLQDFVKPIKADKADVNLEKLLTNMVASIDIPQSIEVHTMFENLPLVSADMELLKRLFTNLLINAIQAMPNGGTIWVEGKTHDGKARVIIRDTGVGIPDAIKPRIFNPLFTTKARGQGFGLAVCKRVAEAHDGTIFFESRERQGTTFIVELPIRQEIDSKTL